MTHAIKMKKSKVPKNTIATYELEILLGNMAFAKPSVKINRDFTQFDKVEVYTTIILSQKINEENMY